ncbi:MULTISPECIES: hypothetical protein [unclassified Nostoc]|uniref:hypothetical protein n=1 Tax=unclassified Nostoc TaxID=2593658 RepID=UPI002AD1D0A2|nr:hypothetical protein [Nostoc sp. DedQUE03]MDZ7975560.1 hypothetical protein [Nostoc sp. DedQUE03]MDZ8048727.1 hypothetical protein [Nostoc sp. DedQUE02]
MFNYYSLFNLYPKPNAELKMHKANSIAVKPVVKHRKLLQWRRSQPLLAGTTNY